ncbi:mannose-1-phosphate guanylyltransferase [Siminovitchia acidinfaciens]|uniref:Mannose-1-phosphate guanylyltransferase n=1 Tax=Siminovitchia acidinfaciens TaxID=2321395 RepID=A0A429XZF0_9BACI|nr:sugar phosphate nucleotidyltransferase [Siminovitchia acidinfaciens]RST74166.1 mannose-1-phosphate guanylyltransferase [Siminovitchia acidinfaciens]
MKLVLLSGGSGKRLWPLSNDARSKQFLKVLEGTSSKHESMVQRVWRQLSSVGLQESAVIATSSSQVDMIHSQLGFDVPLVIEPSRRDTFPAIALSASFLFSVEQVDLDETVIVLPVDPFVEERFFNRVKDLGSTLKESGADLALIGVQPTFPSSKYGYIVPEKGKFKTGYQFVRHFIEKPDEEKAQRLIDQGANWNCGVFAFKLGYLLSILENKGLPIMYDKLKSQYNELPKISFDYEVVEKAKQIAVISYDGYWKDLGTWNTLTEEMASEQIGKGVVCDNSANTHLINELDIPVTVLGISNAVIAVSPDGILVTDKASSPKVKELLGDINQRPMFEERRWGWYRVLDHVTFDDGREVLTKRIGVSAGKNLSYQKHSYRNEVWTIIKGEGEFAFNDEIRPIKAGDVLHIEIGDLHGIKAITDLEFIEVQTGTNLVEEDIVRVFMTWEEVVENCKIPEDIK